MAQRKFKTLAAYFEGPPKRSKRALAKRLGIHESYVSFIASGKRQPSLDLALEIEALTGVPASALVSSERVA